MRTPAARYLTPAIVLMAVMLGFPIVYNIVISFMHWTIRDPSRPFVGFENYANVLTNESFMEILGNTLVWTVVGVFAQMVIGIALAVFVDNLTRGKKYMRIVMLIPWVIPGVVTAFMWRWLMQSDLGLINNTLQLIGLTSSNIRFLSDKDIALTSLIIAHTWKAVPFWFLMITAGLQTKPEEQIEAARLDGAGSWKVFWNVILPDLSPVIASTGVLTTIWTLNYFDLIWVMTAGGPGISTTTLPIYIYQLAFRFNNFGEAAACAVITFIIVGIISAPYMRRMFKNLKSEGVV